MPILILAALVVIVLMLYIALGGREGAPAAGLNKIFDFVSPKAPTDEAARDADAPEAKTTETKGFEASATVEKTVEAVDESAIAKASPVAAEQTDAAPNGGASDGEVFSSMEELTEFYRKEAERLTGIKH
jgi:hypothetical protein